LSIRFLFLFTFIATILHSPIAFSAVTPTPLTSVQKPLENRVDNIISRMTLEEKIGQLFIVAADGNLESIIRTYHPGGFILFSRHTSTILQTMQLTDELRQSAQIPVFIAIDQEGGRVSRLPFAVTVPDARRLGTLPEAALQNIGSLVGQELHALGFNINFAPVLDVDTRAENPVIGNRSFSQDPYTVARLGSAYIRGLRLAGIAAAAKHFPGHGDTSSDSHLVLPVVEQSEDRLQTVELLPFRAALRAGVDLIMMAHVSYPSLDPTPNWPASLSHPIVTDLLRNELEYSGIIITDAMNMKAITGLKDPGQTAKVAFNAGVDIILMPEDLPTAYLSILSAVQSGEIPLSRLNASLGRILALKLRLPQDQTQSFSARLKYALDTVGSNEHRLKLQQCLE